MTTVAIDPTVREPAVTPVSVRRGGVTAIRTDGAAFADFLLIVRGHENAPVFGTRQDAIDLMDALAELYLKDGAA